MTNKGKEKQTKRKTIRKITKKTTIKWADRKIYKKSLHYITQLK